jgi:hypothetical protein
MQSFGELESAFSGYAGAAVRIRTAHEKEMAFWEREMMSHEETCRNALKMFGSAKNMVTLACGFRGTVALSRIQAAMAQVGNSIRNNEPFDSDTFFRPIADQMEPMYEFLRSELGINPQPDPPSETLTHTPTK